MSARDFYDALTPYYHLIFADWEVSIGNQGRALDGIIRSRGSARARTVLDAACGIGTQSLGLARLGYAVTASDISPLGVARAKREAEQRGLSIACSVADMRGVHAHHQRTFDVVLACDNSIPHLLSDREILAVLEQFYGCVTPGGLCLISVRDYSALDLSTPVQIHPYAVRRVDGTRYVLFQVWEIRAPFYDTTFYVMEHRSGAEPMIHVSETTYYAVPIATLRRLMEEAGFCDVERIDGQFFQPVLVGRKREARGEQEAAAKSR